MLNKRPDEETGNILCILNVCTHKQFRALQHASINNNNNNDNNVNNKTSPGPMIQFIIN